MDAPQHYPDQVVNAHDSPTTAILSGTVINEPRPPPSQRSSSSSSSSSPSDRRPHSERRLHALEHTLKDDDSLKHEETQALVDIPLDFDYIQAFAVTMKESEAEVDTIVNDIVTQKQRLGEHIAWHSYVALILCRNQRLEMSNSVVVVVMDRNRLVDTSLGCFS